MIIIQSAQAISFIKKFEEYRKRMEEDTGKTLESKPLTPDDEIHWFQASDAYEYDLGFRNFINIVTYCWAYNVSLRKNEVIIDMLLNLISTSKVPMNSILFGFMKKCMEGFGAKVMKLDISKENLEGLIKDLENKEVNLDDLFEKIKSFDGKTPKPDNPSS